MKRGPFKVLSSRQVYKNPWIAVREDKVVRPSGGKGIFGVVEAKEGVTVLALTADDEVYLVKEFHYATNESSYELPSGGIDEGENSLQAAKRELKEEAGLTAKRWTDLGLVNSFTVMFRSPNYIFLAEDLEKGEAEDKEKDLIKLEKLPLRDCLDLVDRGEITHAATVVAILKVAKMKK